MEDLCSMWAYQENVDDLRQKLVYMDLELEQAKKQADEELTKSKETINQLLDLLKIAYQERDEIRDQLQKLLNKVIPQAPQPESNLVMPGRANSSITESNSLSETHNPHSYGSSPIDSFLEVVTSPDISSFNIADSSNIGIGSMSGMVVASEKPNIDPATAIIDNLVKGKPLPPKGRLLQTLLDSGPLLQTLLLAGPLPRWRNPPTRSFKIPPAPLKGLETTTTVNQKHVASPSQKRLNSSEADYDTSRVSPQMCSASMLNFAAGSCMRSGNLMASSFGLNNQVPAVKRQRLQ